MSREPPLIPGSKGLRVGVQEAQPRLALAPHAPHAPHAPARLDGGTPLSRGPLPPPALRVNARPGLRRLWGEELPVRGRRGKHDMAQAEQEPPDPSPRTRGSQLSLYEKRTDLELKVVKSVTAGGGGGWLRAPPWRVATGVGTRKPARSRRWSPSRESRGQAALGPEPCPPPRTWRPQGLRRAGFDLVAPRPGLTRRPVRGHGPQQEQQEQQEQRAPRSRAHLGAAAARLPGSRCASRSFTRLRAAATRAWPRSHPGVAARAAGTPDKTSCPVRSLSGPGLNRNAPPELELSRGPEHGLVKHSVTPLSLGVLRPRGTLLMGESMLNNVLT